ncbi:MAG: hypothetical protein RL127_1059 [Bacteroidota bacterium]
MSSSSSQVKHNRNLFSIGLICFILFNQCNQAPDRNENSNAEGTAQSKSQTFWNSASTTLKKITLLSSVNEKIELSETQPENGKSYSLYLDNSDLNFVDIVYNTNKENQIIQIVFDIYVEDKLESNKLLNEFDAYFELKYGPKKSKGKTYLWEAKNKTRVQMEDVSTSKDPGIKLIYSLNN